MTDLFKRKRAKAYSFIFNLFLGISVSSVVFLNPFNDLLYKMNNSIAVYMEVFFIL